VTDQRSAAFYHQIESATVVVGFATVRRVIDPSLSHRRRICTGVARGRADQSPPAIPCPARFYAARRCAESAVLRAKILYRSSTRQTAGMALGTIILRYLIR
jgi:hypothetical protein